MALWVVPPGSHGAGWGRVEEGGRGPGLLTIGPAVLHPTPTGPHPGQAGYSGSPLCLRSVPPPTLTLGPGRESLISGGTLYLVSLGWEVGGWGGARGPG